MIDLFSEKINRMSDEELLLACVAYGRELETMMTEKGYLSRDFRIRAARTYYEATQRESLKDYHVLMKTALQVVGIL